MPILVKNVSNVTKTYAGQSIQSNAQYQVQIIEIPAFQSDSNLLADIVSGDAQINNGVADLTTVSEQINHLLGIINEQKDSDGANIVRTKTTQTGWHFEPRSIDFITSKAGSLFNRKPAGNTIDSSEDYGDATLKFFDQNGLQLTQGQGESAEAYQARLDSYCVKSQIDWQATYDMDIIGTTVSVLNPPTGSERAYIWITIAPDIPANLGGNVEFLAGGWNLRFFTLDQTSFLDGRGIKRLAYDPVYNSNKIRVTAKHSPGIKIELQFVAEHFRA